MPERGVYRGAAARGYATPTNAPLRVDSTTNVLKIIPAGTGSTEVEIPSSLQTGGIKIANGSANFVSGAATIATGLTTVTSFQVEIMATGFATGATEVTNATVSGAFTGAIPTGSVTVQGFRLNTQTASASGTGLFYWFAIGT